MGTEQTLVHLRRGPASISHLSFLLARQDAPANAADSVVRGVVLMRLKHVIVTAPVSLTGMNLITPEG